MSEEDLPADDAVSHIDTTDSANRVSSPAVLDCCVGRDPAQVYASKERITVQTSSAE